MALWHGLSENLKKSSKNRTTNTHEHSQDDKVSQICHNILWTGQDKSVQTNFIQELMLWQGKKLLKLSQMWKFTFRGFSDIVLFLRQEKATFGFRVEQPWVNVVNGLELILWKLFGHVLVTHLILIKWQDDRKTYFKEMLIIEQNSVKEPNPIPQTSKSTRLSQSHTATSRRSINENQGESLLQLTSLSRQAALATAPQEIGWKLRIMKFCPLWTLKSSFTSHRAWWLYE